MAVDEDWESASEAGTRLLRRFRPGAFPVLVLAFLAAALYDLSDGVLFLGDIDDRLRAVQIRQFLAGKGWYDLSFSGIAMPGPYVSPWSRLVDAPYAAIEWLLAHVMSADRALQTAFDLWPPVLMLAFAFFSAAAMRKLMPAGRAVSPLYALVAALAMIYPSLEFVPGRIDHHNMQLVTLAAASLGILSWSTAGGVLMAVAFALSMTIGLETLPLVAVLWVGLALAWIARRPGADAIFRAFSGSIVVFAPLATLVFAGQRVLFGVENDIFSAPYVAAFAGFGLVSAAASILLRQNGSPMVRMAALALPGSLLLAGIVLAMPHILAGPYAIIDPVSRQLWLDHVDQEHTVLLLLRSGNAMALATLAVQSALILFGGVFAWREMTRGRAAPLILLAMGAAAFVANLDAFRFIRFPAAVLPLFVPALLTHFSDVPARRQKQLALSFAATAAFSAATFQAVAMAMPVAREFNALEPVDFLMVDTCSGADRKAISALPAGRYMVTPAVGLTFLETAPAGVEVADISYHRASPGMRRMFDGLYQADPALMRDALLPFDYLAFCSYPDGVKALFVPPSGSLFAALLDGHPPAFLIPQPVTGTRHLKLYRIDHDRL